MVTAAREHHERLAPPVLPHEGRNGKVNLLAVREGVENGHCDELALHDRLQFFAHLTELVAKGVTGVNFADALAHERELAIEKGTLCSRRLFPRTVDHERNDRSLGYNIATPTRGIDGLAALRPDFE
jgi:hypothetical protein